VSDVAALVVWLGDEPVGDLAREGRRYDLRFRRRANRHVALTVASDGAGIFWTPGFTRSWFDGLLPEDARRSAAEADHDVERGDSFGLLAAIGWECAGAVSVLPQDRLPATGSYRALSDEQVWERLDALPRLVAEVDHEVRLSLGGVQEKLLLARFDAAWQLPLDGAISTHILKPEPERYPGLAAGEAWALSVASAATTAASAQLLAPPGHRPAVVVERYDRRVTDRGIVRMHQEDGCQVLGLAPAQKYPRGTGPRVASLGRIASLLVARAQEPTVELRRLLEQTTVNVLLLNTDAHAKNLSVLHTGAGTITLSPLYDLVPMAWFLPTQAQLALPVGGKWRIREVERRHLLAEARAWGVPEAVARATIDAALERVRAGIAAADEQHPAIAPGMRDAVVAQVERVGGSDWSE
jgi:serine/threonine-protein kinase HipA